MVKTLKTLLVGIHPVHVDFSKWPNMNKNSLNAGIEKTMTLIKERGIVANSCLVATDSTALTKLQADLAKTQPDIVVIGAGVRCDPDLLELLERMINLVATEAPNAKIAFNTKPEDTVDAVLRWS